MRLLLQLGFFTFIFIFALAKGSSNEISDNIALDLKGSSLILERGVSSSTKTFRVSGDVLGGKGRH